MIITFIMIMSKGLYIVKAKRSYTVVKIENYKFEVLECSNRERCKSMGILSCPPFCDKITELKKFLRFGTSKYKIEPR